jgi:hypothetical protein
MELLAKVVAALLTPDAFTTEELDALNQQAGRDRCNRRNRILYQLQSYVIQNSPAMSAPSTTHQFKKDFHKQKAIIEVNGQTKAVTADNLTDEDVPLLKQYGYGHLIQEKPKPETAGPSLDSLTKAELQAKYKEVVGEDPADSLTKAHLIEAIEAKK